VAGVPELEADDAAGLWVDIAEAGLNLLAHNGRTVESLKAEPGDVGLGVIVPVDLRVRSLFVSPESDDACRRSIASVREVVEDDEAVRGNTPFSWASARSAA
jgi:hypothetical protein